MDQICFEAKGEELLERLGISKSEFARRMGIQRQNVNALFKSKDVRVIRKAAEVLDVPWEMLVGYVEEPGYDEFLGRTCRHPEEYGNDDVFEVKPEDVPTGDSVEDRRTRHRIIRKYYGAWMSSHPEKKIYNRCLKDDIYVKFISIQETAGHASLKYLSTLAVLQLDAVLANAVLKSRNVVDKNTKNQRGFKWMLVMEYNCSGIGLVRLTVGVRNSDEKKVQYCITKIVV